MSLRMAVLGLLTLEPMSGYELKKQIDDSVGHFWSADHPQIYRTLAALVTEGYVTRTTVVQHDRPNMHVHEPTPAGLAALDQWLHEPIGPRPVREPFLVKLFFAGRLEPQVALGLLEDRRSAIRGGLHALESITVDPPSSGLQATLRVATREYGVAHALAELDWLERTITAVRRHATGH